MTRIIFKGSDCTTIKVPGENGGDQVHDEVKEYLDAHYISAIESCWHIFKFNMHKEEPNVYHLPIHLPDQQQVYFNPDDALDEVVECNSA